MRITDLKTVLLTGPSTNDPYFREGRSSWSWFALA